MILMIIMITIGPPSGATSGQNGLGLLVRTAYIHMHECMYVCMYIYIYIHIYICVYSYNDNATNTNTNAYANAETNGTTHNNANKNGLGLLLRTARRLLGERFGRAPEGQTE